MLIRLCVAVADGIIRLHVARATIQIALSQQWKQLVNNVMRILECSFAFVFPSPLILMNSSWLETISPVSRTVDVGCIMDERLNVMIACGKIGFN